MLFPLQTKKAGWKRPQLKKAAKAKPKAVQPTKKKPQSGKKEEAPQEAKKEKGKESRFCCFSSGCSSSSRSDSHNGNFCIPVYVQ